MPNFEKVEANINHLFHINHMEVDYFPSLLHFHPEVEILLVIKGTGTRYVGDSVERSAPGDLVMIDPNVSHEWRYYLLTHLGSNQDSAESKSDVLPITPWVNVL